MSEWYRHKCCICARFCQWCCDSSTQFGNTGDIEPPDPEFYCNKCAKDQENYYVEKGYIPNDWIKSVWQRNAARRIGSVEIIVPGNGWTQWLKKDQPIPEGHIIVKEKSNEQN